MSGAQNHAFYSLFSVYSPEENMMASSINPYDFSHVYADKSQIFVSGTAPNSE